MSGRGDVALGGFLIGWILIGAGAYVFLRASGLLAMLAWGEPLLVLGEIRLTPAVLLIPLVLGLVILVIDGQNLLGWLLTLAALVALTVGVMLELRGRTFELSPLELIAVIGLIVTGFGLFLGSVGGVRGGR